MFIETEIEAEKVKERGEIEVRSSFLQGMIYPCARI